MVPASCAQLTIKKCLANSSGITVEADTDGSGIDAFLENGVRFRLNMKDGSVKTYNGGLLYDVETLINASCLFDLPVKPEKIESVEMIAR